VHFESVTQWLTPERLTVRPPTFTWHEVLVCSSLMWWMCEIRE
jgi:hypothetical protein